MMREIVYRGVNLVVVLALLLAVFPLAASAAGRVEVSKTYELNEAAAYISFILEGSDGEFDSALRMPGGHVLRVTKSNKISAGGKVQWTNEYVIRKAPRGTYKFTISAPKRAYYNLRVNVPLFSDIPGHWAQEDIEALAAAGTVAGYGEGRFGPNDQVTGEALIKMLVLSLTEELPNGKRQWKKSFRWRVKDERLGAQMGLAEYSLLPETGKRWSAPYLSAAKEIGITEDWSADGLREPFKRKEVALLAANVMRMVAPARLAKTPAFSDMNAVEAKYRDAVSLTAGYSVFSGYPDGTFRPEEHVTRAEAAIVITRLLGFLK
ncbi:S-layer homology domain-containing protein [Paenibacillus sp. N4]|uniref:S-layer homology domain-containing protein n=1 Tax=Paenibacillus vietnamensis TaxID=2590547 RepID=UPI001CD0704E|nr:S-layer homology domain-containing protein [Paenibacillus vietnamensis]MCA0756098.1 S-layer homology domain-containing protein [Paenibacillus vietnamensis]